MYLKCFIAELCHNLVFCMCLLIMCTHSNNNAQALNSHNWLPFSLSPLLFSLRTQLTFTEAMRNKARLSITGSVGENGRVLTPDCPKAVHSGPSLRQSSGLALVSSDLPWKPKTFKCLKLHKTAKQTTENRPYSNDATKLSNRADKVDFERNHGPWWLHTPGLPPQDIYCMKDGYRTDFCVSVMYIQRTRAAFEGEAGGKWEQCESC